MWAYEAERSAVKGTAGTGGQSPAFRQQSYLRATRDASAAGRREGERHFQGSGTRRRQHLWKAASVGGSISDLHSQWSRPEGQGPSRGEGRVVALVCLVAQVQKCGLLQSAVCREVRFTAGSGALDWQCGREGMPRQAMPQRAVAPRAPNGPRSFSHRFSLASTWFPDVEFRSPQR